MDVSQLDLVHSRREQLEILLNGCWRPYVDCWGAPTRAGIVNAVLNGVPLIESHLTALYVALDPDAGRPIVSMIDARLELDQGLRFTEKPRRVLTAIDGSRKIIDACHVGPDDRPDLPPVLLEFKLNGAVNGGYWYCESHGEYSNQVRCYPAGCFWSVRASTYYMVWVGLRKHVDHPDGPWGTRGINRRDVAKQTLGSDTDRLFADQNSSKWDAKISLEEMCDAAWQGNLASQVFARVLGQTIDHCMGLVPQT